jgi:hypothetical protein
MELSIYITAGQATITPATLDPVPTIEGTIPALVKFLVSHYRGLLRPVTVQKPKGMRGYSFHWSNAQAAWSVIGANDPTWMTDGAEFLVYFAPSLSPSGRPWTIKDMQLAAKLLPMHPGYVNSVESGDRGVWASRVADRYLAGMR